MTRIPLPRSVCSLDIETTNTNFDQPELSTLLFAGTIEYRLDGERYRDGRHVVWMPDDVKRLERYLCDFEGLIIGHNVLKFDYGVLCPHIQIGGIVEKTVDTLALCWWRRWHTHFDFLPDVPRYLSWRIGPELGKLSLDNLARQNLRSQKTFDPKTLQRVWREDRQKVFEYNGHDCALTKRLWLHLVRQKRLWIEPDVGFALSGEEAAVACGRVSWIAFDDWDTWRRIQWANAEEGEPDSLPFDRCPLCKDWRNLHRYDETQADWSDGQMAEWFAGQWGSGHCGACGLVFDWEGGSVSFQVPAPSSPPRAQRPRVAVRTRKRRPR